MRELPKNTNSAPKTEYVLPKRTLGLTGKIVCVLGAGNVGLRVGKICEAFGMEVYFFKQGDDMANADVVINCLSQNPTTEKLLGGKFFSSFKNGSYFISVTSNRIYDAEALLSLLGKNIAGAAIDAGDARPGDTNDDFYRKLLENGKVLATPHIAFNTDVAARVANDMMIDNIEAYIKGNPINLV